MVAIHVEMLRAILVDTLQQANTYQIPASFAEHYDLNVLELIHNKGMHTSYHNRAFRQKYNINYHYIRDAVGQCPIEVRSLRVTIFLSTDGL